MATRAYAARLSGKIQKNGTKSVPIRIQNSGLAYHGARVIPDLLVSISVAVFLPVERARAVPRTQRVTSAGIQEASVRVRTVTECPATKKGSGNDGKRIREARTA
jgi:hypothetical protein